MGNNTLQITLERIPEHADQVTEIRFFQTIITVQ